MPIPNEVAPLWTSLQNEVIGIHAYWINYRQLFGKTKERVELLSEIAWELFYIVQDVLIKDIQMSLSKLADPPRSVGKPNASLERLVQDLTASDPQFSSELNAKLTVYRDRCAAIKVRRNIEFSHSDLPTLLISHRQAEGPLLPGPSRYEIEQALEALREFMNFIDGHFNGSTMAYEHFVSRGDGDALVFTLKQGMRYEQLERDGKIHYDDLKKSFDRYDA